MNNTADQLFTRLQSRFPKINREKEYWREINNDTWPEIIERASVFMPQEKSGSGKRAIL